MACQYNVFIICFTWFHNHILACSVVYDVSLLMPIENISFSVMAMVVFHSVPYL